MFQQLKNIFKFIKMLYYNECRFVSILPDINSSSVGLIHTNNSFIDYDNIRYIRTEYFIAAMLEYQNSNKSTFLKLRKHSTVEKYNNNSFNNVCGICIEPLKKNTVVRKLDCKHCFHIDCIDQWFEKKCCCPYCNILF